MLQILAHVQYRESTQTSCLCIRLAGLAQVKLTKGQSAIVSADGLKGLHKETCSCVDLYYNFN